jgi:CDP-glycerol glycerophosphotransferase (TagB/SpsB family)
MKQENIMGSTIYTIIISTLLVMVLSKTVILRFSLLFSKDPSFISDWKILFLLGVFLCAGIYLSNCFTIPTKIEISLFVSIFFFLFLQGYMTLGNTEIGVKDVIGDIILRYYWIFILGFIIFAKLKVFNLNLFIKIFTLFMLINSILGIFQYLLRNPIVFTKFNGEPIINSIYFKDGISSSNEWLFNLGSQVRAFGLFDSGLTMGLLCVLAISIILSNSEKYLTKSEFLKACAYGILLCVFLITLYMTLTRNAYLTCFNLLLYFTVLIFFKQNYRYTLIKIIFILEWILFLIYVGFTKYIYLVISKLFPTFNLETFNSRIETYSRVSNLFNNNIINVLLGKGITPSKEWVIDNDLLSIVSHVGIITYILMQFVFIWIIVKGLSHLQKNKIDKNYYHIKGLVFFMMTYPAAATLNYVSYIYFWVAIVVSIELFRTSRTNKFTIKGKKQTVLIHSMNMNNMIPFINYYKNNGLDKKFKLITIDSSDLTLKTKLKKIYSLLFKDYYAVVSDYPTRLLEHRKGLSIAMGHGTAIKKFPSDQELLNKKTLRLCKTVKLADYYITTSERQNSLEFRNPLLDPISKNKYLPLGLPKNDYYFSSQSVSKVNNNIRKKIGISLNDYIILYAPTFREAELTSTPLSEKELYSINKLLQTNNAFMMYRPHILGGTIDVQILKKLNLSRIILLNKYNLTSHQSLCIADALISDYSSITLEYLPLNRPIISYIFDEEEYKKIRGLDFNFYDKTISPGVIVKDEKELFNSLEMLLKGEFNKKEWSNKRSECLGIHYKYPDGKSSERIWRLIEENISN